MTPSTRERLPTVLLLAIPACVVFAFHAAILFPGWSDETVHLYVARRVADGLALYRDIHSARPPLAIVPLVALFKLGLSSVVTARAAVVAALLVTAASLLWAGRRLFEHWTGVAAAAFFLLAPEVASRSAYTAIQWVAAWSTLCWALSLSGAPLLGGIAGGLALATGQHSAVVVAGVGAALLVRNRPGLLRFCAGLGGTLAAVFLPSLVQAGAANIYQDLVGHHLYHVAGPAVAEHSELGWYATSVALDQLLLIVLAAAALWTRRAGAAPSTAVPRGKKRARKERAAVPSAVTPPDPSGPIRWTLASLLGAHVAAVFLMRGGLVLYLFPALPLLALLAADGLVRLVRACWSAPATPTRRLRLAGLATAVLFTCTAGFGVSMTRFNARDHESYPLVPHLRCIVMAHVQRLVAAETITRAITPEIRPGDTLFGHPTIAAQVALETGLRFAGEQADLAPRWIQQGSVSRQDILDRAEADHVRWFITPNMFFERDPFFRQYLERCYGPPTAFPRPSGDGRGIPNINVYRRRDGVDCAPH
jgi:hypothetical protein